MTAKNSHINITFGHLGFKKFNEKWIYIHGKGAIGNDNVKVELNQKLKKYRLSKILFPENNGLKDLLDENFATHKITIPLIGITYLSPLNEFLKKVDCEPKIVIFLSGKTGSKKSTIAALILSHFGNFTNTNLPLSFRDTENSIIEQTFLLKDTLTVIDDFHPSSKVDEISMNKTAQTIMRAFGDRVGKNRLRSDSTLIPSKPPRGNVIITGEHLPDISESGTARYLTVEIEKQDINVDLLSKLQESARVGYFSSIMYQYISWIINIVNRNEKEFTNFLRDTFLSTRSKFIGEFSTNKIELHSRIPESIAWIYVGLIMFFKFGVTNRLFCDDEAENYMEKCFITLYNIAVCQAEFVHADKPTDKFLKKLNTLFSSKLIYVDKIDCPNINATDSFIGYEDDDYYYLITDIVHKKVKRLCEEQGENFTISTRTLLKQLGEENIIEVRNGERTIPIRVGNSPQRLMWLKKISFIERVS